MQAPTTFLFTDIEGSTRLWEQAPEQMRPALARHDAMARAAVESHRGVIVKMTGDGIHAAFEDPLDAVSATVAFQQALIGDEATQGLELRVRCGVHSGANERRGDDYFGTAVNRAARIMSAAHGGQILVSQAVAARIDARLPAGVGLRDLGSVRLRDLTAAERIYQVLHPGLRDDFPALRSLESTPNNLPQQLTSFIGREQVLAEAKALLRTTRLLTLTGVGGLGKTRLSLQLAADVQDEYPDGAWFIELAPLQDPKLVPQAVATVLGVKEAPGQPVAEALARCLEDRRVLLVLDNCEHVLAACAELARHLLEASVHARIVASSREPLHLGAEVVYPLPALATPDPAHATSPAGLEKFDAVRLFTVRGAAARFGFTITDQNAPAIARICHSLDGIPLALELAAARVRTLSVDAIAERLGNRFALLKSRDTTLLPRQQTLRALIDWSHDLLEPAERTLFRRLAVFAGGWTVEAADAVGVGGDLAVGDVLDVLTRLTEKSLVEMDGSGRYRLLETVRQYADERLTESGEADATRARHLAHYLALAEEARPALFGPAQGAWLARLDEERENLLAAHAVAAHQAGAAEPGLRLMSALNFYWINRGLVGLGYRMTVEALSHLGAHGRDLARCRALFDAGQLAVFRGDYDAARGQLEESLAIARELGDPTRIGAALLPLCMTSLGLGDLATAIGYAEEAVQVARNQGDTRRLASGLNALAQIHRMQGDLDVAGPLFEDVVMLARQLGDRESIAIGLLNGAMVAVGQGRSTEARRMLGEVVDLVAETGSKPAAQSLVEVAATVAALEARWTTVARFYGAAEAEAGRNGIQRDAADDAALAPAVSASRATLGDVAFDAAAADGAALGFGAILAEVARWIAPPDGGAGRESGASAGR